MLVFARALPKAALLHVLIVGGACVFVPGAKVLFSGPDALPFAAGVITLLALFGRRAAQAVPSLSPAQFVALRERLIRERSPFDPSDQAGSSHAPDTFFRDMAEYDFARRALDPADRPHEH